MPGAVARKRKPRPLNCWEFRNCGRGPGSEQVCPAALAASANGVNRGTNGGRVCWAVAGTLCGGRQQGTYAVNLETCLRCDFCQLVLREEHAEPCKDLPLGTTPRARRQGKRDLPGHSRPPAARPARAT